MDSWALGQEGLQKPRDSVSIPTGDHHMPSNTALSLHTWFKTKTHFVWDFDGSLCNTEPLHFEAYRRAFLEFGHGLAEHHYYRDFTHLGDGALKEIHKSGLPIEIDQVLLRKKHHYDLIIASDVIPDFIEIKDIVTAMKQAGTVAIASNSVVEEIEIVLQRQGLRSFVDLIIGKKSHLRKKPFPDLFLEAHRCLHAPDKSNIVIFEDSERGLQAAAAAGIDAILLLTNFNRDLEFKAPHVAKMNHGELLKLVKEIL
jgi:beta-phosphoglucomutase